MAELSFSPLPSQVKRARITLLSAKADSIGTPDGSTGLAPRLKKFAEQAVKDDVAAFKDQS